MGCIPGLALPPLGRKSKACRPGQNPRLQKLPPRWLPRQWLGSQTRVVWGQLPGDRPGRDAGGGGGEPRTSWSRAGIQPLLPPRFLSLQCPGKQRRGEEELCPARLSLLCYLLSITLSQEDRGPGSGAWFLTSSILLIQQNHEKDFFIFIYFLLGNESRGA